MEKPNENFGVENVSFRETAYRRASAGPTSAAIAAHQATFSNVSSFNRRQQGATVPSKAVQEIVTEGNVAITKATTQKSEILCLSFTQESEMLAVGLTSGEVNLFKPNTGTCVLSLCDKDDKISPVTGIKHRPVNKSMPNTNTITCSSNMEGVSDTSGYVKSWHCQTGVCIYTINENRQTLGLQYHNRLPKFVTVGDDGKIFLYDEESQIQERVFARSERTRHDGHSSRVFAACFNPKRPHEFISGGWDDCVLFWDLRQPQCTRYLSGAHICGDGLDINRNGTEILTCSWQRKDPLQLWDYGTGKLITNIEPDHINCLLYCGNWITKECFAAGGSEPNILRIIDQRTMATIASVSGLPGGVYSLDRGPVRIAKQGKQKGPSLKGVVEALPKLAFCSDRNFYELDYV